MWCTTFLHIAALSFDIYFFYQLFLFVFKVFTARPLGCCHVSQLFEIKHQWNWCVRFSFVFASIISCLLLLCMILHCIVIVDLIVQNFPLDFKYTESMVSLKFMIIKHTFSSDIPIFCLDFDQLAVEAKLNFIFLASNYWFAGTQSLITLWLWSWRVGQSQIYILWSSAYNIINS